MTATPAVVQNIFHFSSRNLPKLPPAGLALIGVQSEVVALDDGSKVLEIRGEVFNATVEAYDKIRLEAKVYDKENRELDRLVIDFNNGLNNARLNSLQEDSIESLQEKMGMGGDVIKPNTKSPFRIVLTALRGQESYFSARLYSVEARA